MFLPMTSRPSMKSMSFDHSLESFPFGNTGNRNRIPLLKHRNVKNISRFYTFRTCGLVFPSISKTSPERAPSGPLGFVDILELFLAKPKLDCLVSVSVFALHLRNSNGVGNNYGCRLYGSILVKNLRHRFLFCQNKFHKSCRLNLYIHPRRQVQVSQSVNNLWV